MQLMETLQMPDQYFVIRDVRKAEGNVRLTGQFIVDGEVVASDGGGRDGAKARLKPIEPFEVKWILGPNGEGREFAESMGYQTVEHDDFTYPPPRT
jgi:hypothetical protein